MTTGSDRRQSGAALLAGVALFVLGDAGPRGGALGGAPVGGRSHIEGPPAAHTGGFGEPTCVECHIGFDVNEPGGELLLEGLDAGFSPNEPHLLTLILRSEEMGATGFQLAVRFADGVGAGAQAGHLRVVDDRAQVVTEVENGIQYVQHTRLGADALDGRLATWTFEWLAPSEERTVVVHAAANSANGDNSPLSDFIYTLDLTVAPAGAIPNNSP